MGCAGSLDEAEAVDEEDAEDEAFFLAGAALAFFAGAPLLSAAFLAALELDS